DQDARALRVRAGAEIRHEPRHVPGLGARARGSARARAENIMTTVNTTAGELSTLTPAKIKAASFAELTALAARIRRFLIDTNAQTGGHIGANLGTIELSLALHRVFESPADTIVWDTG